LTFIDKLINSLNKTLNEVSKEFIETRKKLNFLANKLLGNEILVLNIDRNIIEEIESIIGIDGSSSIIGSLGGFHLFAIVTSLVIIDKYFKNIQTKYPITIVEYVYDPTASMVDKTIEEVMLGAETFTLSSIHGKNMVLIDGPLIDPPHEVRIESLNKINKVLKIGIDNYHRWRASIIRELLDKGNIVVGIVKRIRSQGVVMKCLGIERNEFLNRYSDETLIAILFESVYRTKQCHNCAFITKPCNILSDNAVVHYYRKVGIEILSSFVAIPPRLKPFRIDIALNYDEELEHRSSKVLRYISNVLSTVPPGHVLPLPTTLAHEKCSISYDAILQLRRFLLSKLVKNMILNSNDITDMTEVSLHSDDQVY